MTLLSASTHVLLQQTGTVKPSVVQSVPPAPAQPPQLFVSMLVSVQVPLQAITVPPPQSCEQVPPLQVPWLPSGLVHGLPQPPQLLGSLSVSTQTPLLPLPSSQHMGDVPVEQTVPHVPQFCESPSPSVQLLPQQSGSLP